MRVPIDELPDVDLERIKHVVVSTKYPAVNIKVYGEKDRRGPDNNVRIWISEDRALHIRVEKANRCYSFKKIIETQGYIEVIQEY